MGRECRNENCRQRGPRMKFPDAVLWVQGFAAAACWTAAVAGVLAWWWERPRASDGERALVVALLAAAGACLLLQTIFSVTHVWLLVLAALMGMAALALGLRWLGLIGPSRKASGAPQESLREELLRREAVERQLRQSLADYRRSAADFEQFAYAASHDLQTPLHNIHGFAELLAQRYDHALDADGREFLGYLRRGVAQMQTLVEALLQLSRLNRRQAVFASRPLAQTIERACEPLRGEITRRGAEIIAPDLPELLADHDLLAQLFRNLFANALKFQPPGQKPRITVRARRDHEDWHLTITDNGIGIPDDQLEQVFAPLHRLHRQDEFDGAGMGLAICRKIAAYHDGEIWAEPHAGGAQIHLVVASRPLSGSAQFTPPAAGPSASAP